MAGKLVRKMDFLKNQVAGILSEEIRKGVFDGGALPSVRSLAKRFGVSTMTISGALDVLEDRRLIDRIKGKGVYVRKSAVDDRPWIEKSKRMRHIGFFCYQGVGGLGGDTYYVEVWEGVLAAAAARSDRITVIQMGRGRELDAVERALAEMRMDGGILLSVTDRGALEKIAKYTVPFVLLDHTFEDIGLDCVDIDSRQGARVATEHLLSFGHREVGFLCSPNPGNNPDRWAGYEDALLAAGLDPKAQFVRAGVPSKAGGYEAARDLLAKGERLPPALLVWGGTMAWGAIRAFREAGVKVPGDVRIATFGSRFFLRNYPGITTAVAEAKSLGGEAVAALGRRIENPDLPPRRIRLPMPLVLGESSTGTPMEEAGMGEPPA